KDLEWAKAGAEHDQLWRNLIEGDLIREKLVADAVAKKKAEEAKEAAEKGEEPKAKKENEEPEKTIYEKVSERYERIQKRVKENNTEDVAGFFIKSIARAYDPHSEYFPESEYE